MRSRKSKDINIFSASVVDLFASGLGVFLIVAIIALTNQKSKSEQENQAQPKVNEEIAKQLAELKAIKDSSVKESRERLDDLKEKVMIDKLNQLEKKIVNLKNENQRYKDELLQLKEQNKGPRLEAGVKFDLKDVYFYGGLSKFIEPFASFAIEDLAEKIKSARGVRFEISGHVHQSKRSFERNIPCDDCLGLSERRAKAVCRKLVSFGVDKTKLTCIGYGARRLKYKTDNDSSKEAQLNRRVELTVLEDKFY